MGIVYKIQHRESGKIYVGQTTRTLEIRMNEHLRHDDTYIEHALKKHGIAAFEVSVIEECETVEALNEREIYWISFYDCICPKGYNICIGGSNGYFCSDKTRRKLSEANKGKKLSDKTRAKMSAARKGKKFSPERRANMSAGNKRKRAVVCIETGQIFESLAAAAKWLNISSKLISKAVNGIMAGAGGYHWCYADTYVTNDELELKPLRAFKRPVRCVETGQIFPSIKSAAKWANLSSDTIRTALNQPTRTAGNYHWCDADSEMDETAMTSAKDRLHAVKCVETGQVFESLHAAAKWAEISRVRIKITLNKQKHTAGGYHWVDAD